ncbi:MAG: hypothetical protein CVU18_06440 [Betaproteobacteria bacterium HGW-Betaproteobacteria-12]|nr:MAG: hypothetical protein CVU18_06440 [Betaproteobacteria bacterium HGW-Betaproteobacteria-12]
MILQPFSLATVRTALGDGWQLAAATRRTSVAYALIFTVGGALIGGGLLASGLTPLLIAAAGAFMLLGPVFLAGFYGIAAAHEAGAAGGAAAVLGGFRRAAPALWVLALVCALLFMIFITDAAILYSYMIGGAPVWLAELPADPRAVGRFLLWGGVSGLFIAFLLFAVSAFAVPLLCERRAGLVGAIVTSVRLVFANFWPAMLWALLLAATIISSCLLLPLLPLTLPWLAYAGRALYRQALPAD